jgi:hypothetical protein
MSFFSRTMAFPDYNPNAQSHKAMKNALPAVGISVSYRASNKGEILSLKTRKRLTGRWRCVTQFQCAGFTNYMAQAAPDPAIPFVKGKVATDHEKPHGRIISRFVILTLGPSSCGNESATLVS